MSTAADWSKRVRILRWVLPVAALVGVLLVFRKRERPAPVAAAKIGRATVAIYDDGRPVGDRWVVFHDPDGRVSASLKSGADGKASSDVAAGSMITVAFGTSVYHLVTVVDVKPGDEVVIGERDDEESGAGNTVATAKVTLPGPYPSAVRYGVSLGVGTTDIADAAAPLPMPVLRRFLVEQRRFPVLGLAFDDKGESPAFSFALATISEKDGGDVEVRLPAWSTDWREHRIVLSNAPEGLTSVTGELGILSGTDRFERGRREASLTSSREATLPFAVPRPLGTAAVYRVDAAYGTSGDKAILTGRLKALPPDLRLDLRELLLPRVSGAAVESAREPARPVVRWTATGDVAKADATVVQLSWPETREHVWTIIAPPTTKPRFEVPALPAALAAWRPDARPIRVAAALVDGSAVAGYDDVRKKGLHFAVEAPEDDEGTVRTSVTGDLVF